MEIKKIQSHRIVLVKFDEIPFLRLINENALEHLIRHYRFMSRLIAPDQQGNISVNLENGLLEIDDREIVISLIRVEHRKIVIRVEEHSRYTDFIYEELKEFLSKLIGIEDKSFLEPLVIARESEIIGKFDFLFDNLFNPAFMNFVNQKVTHDIKTDFARGVIRPAQLLFNIDYKDIDESFDDYRINIERKQFEISPRAGYPVSDQIYYSKAPVNTDTHISLLSDLEKKFSE